MSSQPRLTPDRAVLIGTVVAALVYIRDVRYDFILDDVPLILLDETLTSSRNWKTAFLTHIFAGNNPIASVDVGVAHYRPVYRLWQMLNAQVFGLVLPWWHISSLLLHVAVVFLIYVLGTKLLKHRWTAALAALLFAFHPIHAESVAYVTASTDLLVTLFSLLSFLAYFRFREEQGSILFYLGAILAAALAMLSKETAVMYPWLLVAYEALREMPPDASAGNAQRWKGLVWTLPFFAVVGAYLAVRTALFGLNAGVGPTGSRLAALLDIPLVLVVYLRNLFWPFGLSFFYPAEWGSQWTAFKGAAVLLALVGASFLWFRYESRAGMRLQLLWGAILFVPAVLGVYTFVREDWIHDRHMYFVSVPLCLIAAALLTDSRWSAKTSATAGSVVLAFLLVSLFVEVPRFSDELSIYSSALKVAPRSLLAHTYYGIALWGRGNAEEGLRELKTVTELAPQSPPAHRLYGEALARIGRDEEAKGEYKTALQLYPGSAQIRASVLSKLAEVELKHAELPDAAAHLREALQIAPQTLNYHALLAQALSREGHSEEADQEMRLEAANRQKAAQEQQSRRE